MRLSRVFLVIIAIAMAAVFLVGIQLTLSTEEVTIIQPLKGRAFGNDAMQGDFQRSQSKEFLLGRERFRNRQVRVNNRDYFDPHQDNFKRPQPGREGLYNHRQLAVPERQRLNRNIQSDKRQGVNVPQNRYQGLEQNVQSDDLLSRFPLLSDFTFPQPAAVRPVAEVAEMPWVQSLRQHLNTLDNKQIDMVTSNMAYRDVLLNWLISATVRCNMSLSRILVITLDSSLHQFLVRKEIPSVFLSPESLLNPRAVFSQTFEKVMMIRLAVMRLLNYWGFDVANYDTDAIILKDPQPLYDALPDSDIIGSVGKIPEDLVAEWGITICIGVVVLKSSERTEDWWNSMPGICEDCVDDQGKLNCGLKALGIRWTNNDSDYQITTVHGMANNGLQVSILPYDDICRQTTCVVERRDRMYIWHKGGQRNRKKKLNEARDGKTWFLRYMWSSIENKYTGVQWLSSIAYYFTTHS